MSEITERKEALQLEIKYLECVETLLGVIHRAGGAMSYDKIKDMTLDEVIKEIFVPYNITFYSPGVLR